MFRDSDAPTCPYFEIVIQDRVAGAARGKRKCGTGRNQPHPWQRYRPGPGKL